MDRMEWERIKKHCPHHPWCQDDPDDIGNAVVDLMMDQEPFINKWAWKWYENMQFVYGNHHVKWSRRYGVAVDFDFMKSNRRAVNQRSHTNLSRIVAESLGSAIYSKTPAWEANAPDDSVSQSRRWARVSQAILDAYVATMELHGDLRAAAPSFATFGQIAAEVRWDYSQGREIQVPMYGKQEQMNMRSALRPEPMLGGVMSSVSPALGSNGLPWMSETWQPMSDESGMPMMKSINIGGPRIHFMTPFEYRREPGSSGMHTAKWIQRIRMVDFDDWVREYGSMEGKTKYYGRVEPENMSRVIQAFAVRHFLRLHQITPMADNFWRDRGDRFTDYVRRKILVIEHWDRPCEQWPRGRRSIIANGFCTHITEPQFKTNKLGGWHPFVEAQWFRILPSPMAIGPLHDVVEKNRQLNTTDSLIATALLRSMGSKLLIKTGQGLDKEQVTGTPGEVHEVADPMSAMAYVADPAPINPAIKDLRNEFKEDTYESSGAGDALRGQRTVGASSGYAYRIAQEREEKRITPPKKEFDGFVGGIGEKLLACVKANAVQLGDDVIGYIKRNATGNISTQDIIAFLATPMDFGIDVTVKEGSMEMKSKASHQANLIELVGKTPLGQRLAQDSGTMDKFLEEFGAEDMRDSSAGHRDRARRENELFGDVLKLGPQGKVETLPVVWDKDDHDIHMNEHIDWIIENDVDVSRNPYLFEMVTLHVEQHRIQKRELSGEVPLGTSDVVPQLAKFQRPAPTLQGVIRESQQMQQQKAMEGQQQPPPQQQGPQAANGPTKAPQAASSPPMVGSGGPRQQTTEAAPENTPAGRQMP